MASNGTGTENYCELIKREHVENALQEDKGSQAKLKNYEIKNFTQEGDNYISAVTSVSVSYEVNGEEKHTSYVVKINPCKSENLNTMVNILFRREISFFKKVLPLLNAELTRIDEAPLRIPKCFFSHDTKGEEALYLEDLRLRKFIMFDKKKSMDQDHSRLVVKELAKLHASSVLMMNRGAHLGKDFLDPFPELINWSDAVETNGGKPVFKDMVASFLETAAAIASRCKGYENVAKSIKSKVPIARDLYEEQMSTTKQFQVIYHADCWTNNFLFRYSEDGKVQECQLIDWQLVSTGSQALDLNFFLHVSLDGEERKNSLASLFNTYYANFASILAGNSLPIKFTFQQMLDEFSRKKFYGFVCGALLTPLILGIPFDVDSISGEDNLEKYEEYQDELLSTVEQNTLLRPRFLSLLDDMVESGVIEG